MVTSTDSMVGFDSSSIFILAKLVYSSSNVLASLTDYSHQHLLTFPTFGILDSISESLFVRIQEIEDLRQTALLVLRKICVVHRHISGNFSLLHCPD